jgi:hypothetical protein
MPWHTRRLKWRKGVAGILINFMEVHNTSIVVVLAGEEGLIEFSGVNISQRMVVSIPSPEAKIQATDSRKVIVNNDDLLVVRPELDAVCTGIGMISKVERCHLPLLPTWSGCLMHEILGCKEAK